jgi:hypothetical protein
MTSNWRSKGGVAPFAYVVLALGFLLSITTTSLVPFVASCVAVVIMAFYNLLRKT